MLCPARSTGSPTCTAESLEQQPPMLHDNSMRELCCLSYCQHCDEKLIKTLCWTWPKRSASHRRLQPCYAILSYDKIRQCCSAAPSDCQWLLSDALRAQVATPRPVEFTCTCKSTHHEQKHTCLLHKPWWKPWTGCRPSCTACIKQQCTSHSYES